MFNIKDRLNKRFNKLSLELIRDSYLSTVVKGIGLIFGVLVSIFLGRTLGADGYGVITLANRVGGILIVFCFLGMKQVIVKEVSIGYDRQDWPHIGNVMYSSYLLVGGFTLLLAIIFAIFSSYLANNVFNEPRLEIPLVITFIVLIPQVFTNIFSSSLVGFKKIWQSIFIGSSLDFIIIGLILVTIWGAGLDITIISVAIVYGIGRFVISVIAGFYWRTLFKDKLPRQFIGSSLLKTSAPLMLAGASSIVYSNADTIMLGWLSISEEVGLYNVAARLALLTSLFAHISNTVISPRIATLFDKKKLDELKDLLQKVTTILFFIGLVPLLLFIFFGEHLLSIWGEEFTQSYYVLITLSIVQFVNLSTGATGVTLSLCGEEKILGSTTVVFAFINLLLNYFLIKNYGALGAAFATAITLVGRELLKIYLIKRNIGVLTIPNFRYIIQWLNIK